MSALASLQVDSLLSYAIARVRNDDVSGHDAREGLNAILFGPDAAAIDVGRTGIDPAFATILRGGAIDLHGTSGPLDFDAQGGTPGTPSSDVQISCIAPGATPAFISAGMTWHAATSTLDGTPNPTCTQ